MSKKIIKKKKVTFSQVCKSCAQEKETVVFFSKDHNTYKLICKLCRAEKRREKYKLKKEKSVTNVF